jgi:hypothetical protein
MTSETLDAILERCVTVRALMEAVQRRVLHRPGHQNATPAELLAKARQAITDIDALLKEDA